MPPTDEESRLEVPERFGRPWLRSDHPVARQVVRPLEGFVRTEAGSGTLLLAAAVAALVWTNAAPDSYDDFWTTSVVVEVGSLTFEEDFRHLVNDLLMALFFYVVSLEVKREVLFGALRERGSAGVPVAAALGTMVGSAIVYSAVNMSGGDLSGWAVPIATDIAFVLAVLGVAGHRAPRELRAFMLTLAVVDDLGTIAVIAIFFGESISLAWLGAAVGIVLVILLLQRLGVRLLFPYVLAAGLLWLAVFESGVHATVAGVVLGFLTPAATFYPRDETSALIGDQLTEIRAAGDTDEVGEATMQETSRLAHEAVSPLVRMETALHPWSAYVVLPAFALANAGVPISVSGLGDAVTSQIGLGILLGLVVGAPLGGILFALGLSRLGRLPLPRGLDWPSVVAGTPLKGIGFTVAIFLAMLAFDDPAKVDQAKLSILLASTVAAAIGLTAITLRHRTVASRDATSR
jgi:Na+:H+ antiporter, NhaA family